MFQLPRGKNASVENGFTRPRAVEAGSPSPSDWAPGDLDLSFLWRGRWLIVANFRETSLDRLHEGQPAAIAFRGLPGRLFDARVTSIGWGVSQGQGVPSGQLPDVKIPSNWVPPAQRFQVRLALNHPESVPLRVGMTGSVAVYTQSEGWLNHVTSVWHKVIAWLYYL